MNASSSSSKNGAAVKKKIEAIPSAMYQMGWPVSAALMGQWLRSPAWILPREWKSPNPPDPSRLPSAHLDQRIVRMSWAMSIPRLRVAMIKLRAKMANAPARETLRGRLADLSWEFNNRIVVGSLRDSAIKLEKICQSNFQSIGGRLDTMDDLYGGIGMATLKVALIGDATRHASTGRITMKVTHAGFYLRDTYDFTGLQYLGTWTRNGVLSKAQMILNAASDGMAYRLAGEPIGNLFNHDFETYRRATGLGGDFVLYSDVHWERADLLLELG